MRRALARLPSRLREALHRADEAEAHVPRSSRRETRKPSSQVLAARRGADASAKAAYVYDGGLARDHMLAELAVPAIKGAAAEARDAFIADLAAVVEADRRVTLREFVLLTYLRQRLREGAGQPIRTQFRRIEEVGRRRARGPFLWLGVDKARRSRKAPRCSKLGWTSRVERERWTTAKVNDALERLRHLAPFEETRGAQGLRRGGHRRRRLPPARRPRWCAWWRRRSTARCRRALNAHEFLRAPELARRNSRLMVVLFALAVVAVVVAVDVSARSMPGARGAPRRRRLRRGRAATAALILCVSLFNVRASPRAAWRWRA